MQQTNNEQILATQEVGALNNSSEQVVENLTETGAKAQQSQIELKPTDVSDKESAKISLGKFKDVQSLIQAYNSLQAEFTKRCQRIKELEGEVNAVDKVKTPTEETSVESVAKPTGITEEDKQNILKDYLKGVVALKQKAVILDGAGSGVKTPCSKPKTLAEAGALALEILK